MIADKKHLKTDLSFFIGIVITLLTIGLLFIYSSSSVFALEKMGSAHFFFKKQLFGLIIGLMSIIIIRLIPLEIIKKCSPYFFLASLFLTLLTIITPLGRNIHGSARWLSLPFFSFQPSELLKISLVLYVAYFLTKKEKNARSFWHGYIPLMVILSVASIILLKQPDFGLTIILIATVFIMLYIAHMYLKYVALSLLAVIPLAAILIILKAYRLKRILIFLNPWADAQGAGFQIIQSLIAIGSGGLWGVGIGQSKQKFFYLPMQHTDFIFSIIAEETGLLGATFVIFLFLLFLYFGIRIAYQLTDRFTLLATFGFVILISLQALINICVATGLAPTKGSSLPFISYGNTALVCQLMMIGFIISFVCENRNSRQTC
jgi:cell division protein FtsW